MSTAPESPFGFYANLSDDEGDRERPQRNLHSKVLFGPGYIDYDDSIPSQLNSPTVSTPCRSSNSDNCAPEKMFRSFNFVELGVSAVMFLLFIATLVYIDFINNRWLQKSVSSYLMKQEGETDL